MIFIYLCFMNGTKRTVLFFGNYALKFPSFRHWRCFLCGMLANDSERVIWEYGEHRNLLCPILFSLPFGLLNVMPKCQILTCEQFDKPRLKEILIELEGF
jgi:hypothetical protein